MTIDKSTAEKIARLAAIEIANDEKEKIITELNDTLGMVNKLSEVNTDNVVPTSHVHGSTNAFREDVVVESLPKERLTEIAPDFSNAGFRVPKVI